MPPKHARQLVEKPSDGGPVFKFRARHEAGLALAVLKNLHLVFGKDGIEIVEICFVVQAEGARGPRNCDSNLLLVLPQFLGIPFRGSEFAVGPAELLEEHVSKCGIGRADPIDIH